MGRLASPGSLLQMRQNGNHEWLAFSWLEVIFSA